MGKNTGAGPLGDELPDNMQLYDDKEMPLISL